MATAPVLANAIYHILLAKLTGVPWAHRLASCGNCSWYCGKLLMFERTAICRAGGPLFGRRRVITPVPAVYSALMNARWLALGGRDVSGAPELGTEARASCQWTQRCCVGDRPELETGLDASWGCRMALAASVMLMDACRPT